MLGQVHKREHRHRQPTPEQEAHARIRNDVGRVDKKGMGAQAACSRARESKRAPFSRRARAKPMALQALCLTPTPTRVTGVNFGARLAVVTQHGKGAACSPRRGQRANLSRRQVAAGRGVAGILAVEPRKRRRPHAGIHARRRFGRRRLSRGLPRLGSMPLGGPGQHHRGHGMVVQVQDAHTRQPPAEGATTAKSERTNGKIEALQVQALGRAAPKTRGQREAVACWPLPLQAAERLALPGAPHRAAQNRRRRRPKPKRRGKSRRHTAANCTPSSLHA